MGTPFIKVQVEGDDIVIRVNKHDLQILVENDPEYKYYIHDIDMFAKEIVFEIENSTSVSNNESMNRAEELFQWAYERVYEQGDDEVMTGEELSEYWKKNGL